MSLMKVCEYRFTQLPAHLLLRGSQLLNKGSSSYLTESKSATETKKVNAALSWLRSPVSECIKDQNATYRWSWWASGTCGAIFSCETLCKNQRVISKLL